MTNWSTTIEQLFATHRARLESLVIRRIRNREAAADIVQDIFERVFKAGSAGSSEDNVRVLLAAARNASIDHSRMHSRRALALTSILPEQIVAGELSSQVSLEARQALTALDHALAKLPQRSRDIFILHRVHGVPNAEIAKRFGIIVAAVEKQLTRTLQHCQEQLAHHLDRA